MFKFCYTVSNGQWTKLHGISSTFRVLAGEGAYCVGHITGTTACYSCRRYLILPAFLPKYSWFLPFPFVISFLFRQPYSMHWVYTLVILEF